MRSSLAQSFRFGNALVAKGVIGAGTMALPLLQIAHCRFKAFNVKAYFRLPRKDKPACACRNIPGVKLQRQKLERARTCRIKAVRAHGQNAFKMQAGAARFDAGGFW